MTCGAENLRPFLLPKKGVNNLSSNVRYDPGSNLYQRLAIIRDAAAVIQKDKTGDRYMYVSDEAIMAKISTQIKNQHVSLVPRIVPGTARFEMLNLPKVKFDKAGNVINSTSNEAVVYFDMEYRWVNDDNPDEFISVPWFAIAQMSTAAQAFGSALSYTSRYFKLAYFSISDVNSDPEQWYKARKEAEDAEKKVVLRELIDQIDVTIRQMIDAGEESKTRALDIVGKHIQKDGKPSKDYKTVKDPEIAAAILRDLTE